MAYLSVLVYRSKELVIKNYSFVCICLFNLKNRFGYQSLLKLVLSLKFSFFKFPVYLVFTLLFSFLHSQKRSSFKKNNITEHYSHHLLSSQNFGINILENKKSIDRSIAKGKLVKIKKKSRGYRLLNLEYSRPYLIPKAKITLENLANQFATKTKSFFVVSSVTRTMDDQRRLRKVNRNATNGNSTHSYGNAFDISYIRYDNQLRINKKLDSELEKILEYNKKIGRIYYIKEKHQSCYHITVRNY